MYICTSISKLDLTCVCRYVKQKEKKKKKLLLFDPEIHTYVYKD